MSAEERAPLLVDGDRRREDPMLGRSLGFDGEVHNLAVSSEVPSDSAARLKYTNLNPHSENIYDEGAATGGNDFPNARPINRSANSNTDDDGSLQISEDPILDTLGKLQACVFIEDAVAYRSLVHKTDMQSLQLYRLYYSLPIRAILYTTQFVLLVLAFFEHPSSLSESSDIRLQCPRVEFKCGVTESIELVCLIILAADVCTKCYLIGGVQTKHSPWLVAYIVVMCLSFVDWTVTVAKVCNEVVRIRRYFRPIFLFQHSSLMKKMVHCLYRTLPQLLSVILLLILHLYAFTLFAMLLFSSDTPPSAPGSNSTTMTPLIPQRDANDRDILRIDLEGYFSTLFKSILSMLVLLTTANNPDLMLPAYEKNRWYSLFFVVYIVIGVYCFMNMLTAVVYNQFRGYFLDSMQGSLFRRRLGIRACFEVLQRRNISDTGEYVLISHLEEVVQMAHMRSKHKSAILKELHDCHNTPLSQAQFEGVFTILEMNFSKSPKPPARVVENPKLQILQRIVCHHYFSHLGSLMAFVNIICISVELATEYESVMSSNNSVLGILNMVFVLYYFAEQCVKIWALGWPLYLWDNTNKFDGCITILLVLVEGLYVCIYGLPFNGRETHYHWLSLWDLVRIVNILIMIRLFRIITEIKAMFVVFSTLVDLLGNLKSFMGIMITIYYVYGLLGMQLFGDAVMYSDYESYINSSVTRCGTYQEMGFWSNNFIDFGSSLIVLWNVMVVNNWQVFLYGYSEFAGKWAVSYFISWWMLATIVCLNLFTALILENFIMRWDRIKQNEERMRAETEESLTASTYLKTEYMTVHDMFRAALEDPTEESIVTELRNHPHHRWDNPVV